MNRLHTLAVLLVATLLVSFPIFAETTQPAGPQSATALELDGDRTLFVADSDGGQIFAFELPKAAEGETATESKAYNLVGFGSTIADHLKTQVTALRFHDLAVHPTSKDAYVAVGVRDAEKPVVVRVTQAGGVSELDLAALPHSKIALDGVAHENVTFWRDIPASTFAVTDLDFAGGHLYVSGLSTGEFASTLRKIPFPFEDKVVTSSIEIFHTAHNQQETRAPIRAMTVVNLDGVDTVVAAYTCTPLVTVPVSALENGKHVKGKTIAELGYGNTPLEVVSYRAYNMQQQPEDVVLVINREMDADLIKVTDLASAAKAEGLTQPVGYLGATLGVQTSSIPMSGVVQAADQDGQFLLTLKRNLDTGDMDLVSFRKGAYMRLSDFVSEYNFPDFEYPEDGDMTRQFQNMLKMDEGYADRVRQ
ncbi:MAG: hypothetical protein AAGD38_05580 [Acidobacteriota bacterium]